MPKVPLFFIILVILLIYSGIVYFLRPDNNGVYKAGASLQADRAVSQARHLYASRKAQGENLSFGPCLSDALMPNWVADLVHNPRQAIDDEAAYQCPAFLENKANHFVELDLDGNVVRVK